MSWHCSQALAGVCSELDSSGGGQSARSSGNHTAVECLCNDKTTECSIHSQFGMTLGHLTLLPSADGWMSLLLASPANHSQSQASKREKMTSETCGLTPSGAFAKWDHATACWKMYPALFDVTISAKSSETWQMQGTMRNGILFQRKTLVPLTGDDGSGYLPTPMSQDWKGGMSRQFQLSDYARKWPTPRASEYKSPGMSIARREKGMAPEHLTVKGDYNRKGLSKHSGDGLATAVARWPTPTHCDWKGSGPTVIRKDGKDRRQDRLDYAVEQADSSTPPSAASGSLNPTWVEWLMGWPLGWTGLKPLETDKYQQWLEWHGIY